MICHCWPLIILILIIGYSSCWCHVCLLVPSLTLLQLCMVTKAKRNRIRIYAKFHTWNKQTNKWTGNETISLALSPQTVKLHHLHLLTQSNKTRQATTECQQTLVAFYTSQGGRNSQYYILCSEICPRMFTIETLTACWLIRTWHTFYTYALYYITRAPLLY